MLRMMNHLGTGARVSGGFLAEDAASATDYIRECWMGKCT